jgi:hypothetical protein
MAFSIVRSVNVAILSLLVALFFHSSVSPMGNLPVLSGGAISHRAQPAGNLPVLSGGNARHGAHPADGELPILSGG